MRAGHFSTSTSLIWIKYPWEHCISSPSECWWIFQEAYPDWSLETWSIFAVMRKYLHDDPCPDRMNAFPVHPSGQTFSLKWESLFEHWVTTMYIKPCNGTTWVNYMVLTMGDSFKKRQWLSSRNMHTSVDCKLSLSCDLAFKFASIYINRCRETFLAMASYDPGLSRSQLLVHSGPLVWT